MKGYNMQSISSPMMRISPTVVRAARERRVASGTPLIRGPTFHTAVRLPFAAPGVSRVRPAVVYAAKGGFGKKTKKAQKKKVDKAQKTQVGVVLAHMS